MTRRSSSGATIPATVALTLVASALSVESVSRADEGTVVAVPPQSTVVAEPLPASDTFTAHQETRGPNLVMIGGGIVTFGVSYGIAAIAGATSSHQGDGHLFVPVVGPWLDLGDRGSCGVTGGTPCDLERGNRIGLVFDGVFQGIGVLAVVGGFVFREKRELATSVPTTTPTLQIGPVQYAHGGMGVAAIGSF